MRFIQARSIFQSFLLGSVPIIVSGALLWYVVYAFYSQRTDRQLEIRRLSHEVLYRTVELADERSAFMNEDLTDPEFYRTGQSERLGNHASVFTELWRDLSRLEELVPKEQDVEIERLRDQFKEYEGLVGTLAAKYRQLGFVNQGLEGDWQRAIESVRLQLKPIRDLRLENELLTIRQEETNYLYQNDLDQADHVNSLIRAFDARMSKQLGRQHPALLALRKNKKAFDAFIALEQEIGFSEKEGLRAAIRALSKTLESAAIQFAAQATKLAAQTRRELGLVSLALFFLIAASEILAFYFLARSLSLPLRALSQAMSEVRGGNTDVQIPSGAQDEVGALAAAFREMLANLTKTQKQLLQSQKMEAIGTLAGGIAHDFNNLLSGILAYARILKKRHQSDEKSAQDLAVIEQTAERAAELTKQLLGYARKGAYEKRRFSLGETILEARKLLYRTIDKTIAIKADIAADLELIEGDSGQILQALMNLGINARDAMPEGGELWFEAQNFLVDESFSQLHRGLEPGHYVRLSVSDTGLGIPKEIQDRIFEPFFTTKEVGKGTGLGLSMVYGIMENHGGIVSLYSELGKGTRFHLYIPSLVAPHALPLNDAETEVPVARAPSDRLMGRMILIVDDEALMRDLAKGILEPEGATLFFASDGEEALAFLEKNHSLLQAVLLDVIMPKMDGIRVFKELRKISPELPVIFSSGYAESAQIAKLRQEPGVYFIQKPYRSEHLLNQIFAAMAATDEPKAA